VGPNETLTVIDSWPLSGVKQPGAGSSMFWSWNKGGGLWLRAFSIGCRAGGLVWIKTSTRRFTRTTS